MIGFVFALSELVTDAMAWPLRMSHYLEIVNPLWTRHVLRARVESVWYETADVRTLTLRPGRNLCTHRAGQHMRVDVVVGGVHCTRTYSISSAPERDDGCITITVKAVAGGGASDHLVRNIKVGDVLSIGTPQGDFVLSDATSVQPLFISAGSGITPIMSMLRSLIAREPGSDITHIHYAPHPRDVIFRSPLQELRRLNRRYKLHLIYTRDASADPSTRHERRFSAEQLDLLCHDYSSRDVYACGPRGLLDALETHFRERGLSSKLHTERYHAVVAPAPRGIAVGRVRFAKSGVEVVSDGIQSLLQLAEQAGLKPATGCRMGICHGCQTTLRSGAVRDLRTDTLIREPGHVVQPCIVAAVGDAEVDL
jgi:ferredoxin-NADP reductase